MDFGMSFIIGRSASYIAMPFEIDLHRKDDE